MKLQLIWPILNFLTSYLCSAEFILEDFKLQPFLPTSMAFTFAANVSNDGKPPNNSDMPALRVEMIQCCQTIQGQNEQDCESMKVRSGLHHRIKPGERKSLLTFFPNKHLINRIGFCTFRIRGASSIKAFRIDFNTTQGYPQTAHTALATKGPKPCKFMDEDPVRDCKPVNCMEKYLGYRSFFNKTSSTCEPTPLCLDTKKLETDDELLHKEEHQPVLMLNPDTNKCVNETVYKKLKPREIILLDERERKMPTDTFAALYGITLAKLTVAIILTIIFMIVICIVLKFCFCCLPCCVVFQESQEKLRKSNCKPCTKYMPIIDETEAPDSATRIIREIRDRREMPKKKPQTLVEQNSYEDEEEGEGEGDENYQWNKSKDESPDGGSSFSAMRALSNQSHGSRTNSMSVKELNDPSENQEAERASAKSSTHTVPPPSSKSTSRSIITFRKLPNVARLLHQVDNIREKKSENYSRLALSQELERAFGKDMRFSENMKNPLSSRQTVSSLPQENADPSSRILNLKDVPPLTPTIHKVQEAARETHYFPTSNEVKPSRSRRTQANMSDFQKRHGAQNQQILQMEDGVKNEGNRSRVNFANWTSVASDNSVNRFYKAEMAKAASFLRELEQRRGDTSPIYFEKRPLLPEQVSSLGKASEKSPRKAQDQDRGKASSSAMTKCNDRPIRRIKDEAPIPLSMICSSTTICRLKQADAEERLASTVKATSTVEETNLSWEQQPDKVFETFHTPVCTSTPKTILRNSSTAPIESYPENILSVKTSNNPFFSFDNSVNSSKIQSKGNSRPSTSSESMKIEGGSPNQVEIPLQFQIPSDFKSKLAPFSDATSFTVPIPVKCKETKSSVKFQENLPCSSNSANMNCQGTSHGMTPQAHESTSKPENFQKQSCSSHDQANHERIWIYSGRSSGGGTNEGKFQIVKEINSQKLIHSPPQLSESDTSVEGSECLESRNNPRSTCFFDDYLQPMRKPSKSDEVLMQNTWINNFRSE